MTLMSVLMDHINVQLMLNVTIPLAHIFVYAILASLGMEEPVHAWLDLLKMWESAMT